MPRSHLLWIVTRLSFLTGTLLINTVISGSTASAQSNANEPSNYRLMLCSR